VYFRFLLSGALLLCVDRLGAAAEPECGAGDIDDVFISSPFAVRPPLRVGARPPSGDGVDEDPFCEFIECADCAERAPFEEKKRLEEVGVIWVAAARRGGADAESPPGGPPLVGEMELETEWETEWATPFGTAPGLEFMAPPRSPPTVCVIAFAFECDSGYFRGF